MLGGDANPPQICQEITWADRPIQVRNFRLAYHTFLAANTTPPPTLIEKGLLLRHWRGKARNVQY